MALPVDRGMAGSSIDGLFVMAGATSRGHGFATLGVEGTVGTFHRSQRARDPSWEDGVALIEFEVGPMMNLQCRE
jgi:hypothetical protein